AYTLFHYASLFRSTWPSCTGRWGWTPTWPRWWRACAQGSSSCEAPGTEEGPGWCRLQADGLGAGAAPGGPGARFHAAARRAADPSERRAGGALAPAGTAAGRCAGPPGAVPRTHAAGLPRSGPD